MAWDAGSIESSLDVDLSPFHHGLEKAKAEAREFADKRYTATVDINTRRSTDELTAVEQRLHSIESSIDRIGSKTRSGGGAGGRGGFFSRLGGLPAPSGMALGIGAAIPAAVPFAGLAGGIAGGALSAGASGLLGLGAFGLAAKSNVSTITGDITKLNKLTGQYNVGTTDKQRAAVLVKEQALWKSLDPAQRAAVKNVQHLDSAWASYKKKLEPQTFRVVADGAKIATTGLNYLLPTAQAVGNEIDHLAKRAEHAFKAPFWHQFFGSFLPGEAARSVDALGTTLGNVGTGVAHLVQDFAPLAHLLEGGSTSLSARFEKWTEGSGPGKFVAWVEKEGPVAAKALSGLASGVGGLIKGFAPIGSLELKALTPILNFLGKLGDEHPAVITALGGALLTLGAGLKAVKLVGSIPGLGRIGGGGGLGGGGGVFGKATPIPVYVTNWQGGPHGGPVGAKGAATTAEEEAAGRGGKNVLTRAAEKVGLHGAARGAARLAPLIGPGVDVLTLATSDSAPHTPLGKRGDVYSQLFNVLDPSGKKDFPSSFYPGNKLNVSAAVTSLATTGSASQVAQLRDLAKTYPQIAAALKGVQEAADSANDSLDREKSSVAALRAQFATLGPQVMQSLTALARTPAFLRDAEAAALSGGFVIGKNLKQGMVIGFQGTSGVRFTNITQTSDGRNHVSTVKARRAGGGPVTAGELYQVNEQGVELFRPAVNGTIVPHSQTHSSAQYGGQTRWSLHDMHQLARLIADALAARLPGVNQGALDRSLGIAVMSA